MKVVILALSYKNRGICLAGLDLDTYEFVRLGHNENGICKPMNVNEMYIGDHLLKLLDVVDVVAIKMSYDGCQTENYSFIRFETYLGKMSYFDLNAIYQKLPRHQFAMVNTSKKVSSNDMHSVDYSLGLFKVNNLNVILSPNQHGNLRPQSSFDYNGHRYICLSTTDADVSGYPAIYAPRKAPFKATEAFVLISFPPKSDPYTQDCGYFKYVSGIILSDI